MIFRLLTRLLRTTPEKDTMNIVAYDTRTGAAVTYREAEELTRKLLDELARPFVYGDRSYPAGLVLEAVDWTTFKRIVLDEIDARISDGEWTEDPPEGSA